MTNGTEITFCVTARSGLGHLRRVTNIASSLHRLHPGISLSLLVNAEPACLSDGESRLFGRIVMAERREMAGIAAQVGNGPVIVDTAAVPNLGHLARPLGLILRETVAERIGEFRLSCGRRWDCVIVPSPTSDWTVQAETVRAEEVLNVGWIYRAAGESGRARVIDAMPGTKTVLVAAGGGGAADRADGFSFEIDGIIAQIKAQLDCPVRVIQALGPRAKTALKNIDEVRDVGSHLNAAFGEVDLVITTAGYNSILELAQVDTPVLLFPVARTYDDQLGRARRWEKRLGRVHEPGAAEATANWAAAVLSQNARRRRNPLGKSGCDDSAQIIVERLCSASRRRSSAFFEKTLRSDHAGRAQAGQVNSTALFAVGINTLPAVAVTKGRVRFARIEGENARDLLAEQRPDPASLDFQPVERLLQGIIVTLADLHRNAAAAGLDISPLQPWRRIQPRLPSFAKRFRNSPPGPADFVRLLAQRQQLMWKQEHLRDRVTNCVVHGDFHCGQLLRPPGSDEFLLLDLDDLAIGCAESDVANFVAHFVTSDDLFEGDRRKGFTLLIEICHRIYGTCQGRELDKGLLDYYGSVSILRRALKRAEQSALPAVIKDIRRTAEEIFESSRKQLLRRLGHVISSANSDRRVVTREHTGART